MCPNLDLVTHGGLAVAFALIPPKKCSFAVEVTEARVVGRQYAGGRTVLRAICARTRNGVCADHSFGIGC